MTRGVGLSVGATNLAAAGPGAAVATRRSVLTLYPHRPPEVGVPSENPRLGQRGLVVTGFVDRAGDPVGVVAADGSFHRGEVLIADALRALTHTVVHGRAPAAPPGVTFPAHWSAAAAGALRRELAVLPEWSATPERLTLISDAAAALTALQTEPGLPTRGVIALCDFGGTGTTITLADAADGYRPIGTCVRHADLSGELIDRALLAHVIAELSIAGTADVTGTAAIGWLHRLRAQCRGAKERLSRGAVTTLFADVPGHRGDVRLTRHELDAELRQPVTAFIDVLRELLFRNRIHRADLAAVASVGGCANIPAITAALSKQLRVPVITTAHPELAAARGAALRSVRTPQDERLAAVACPVMATRPEASRRLSAARPRVHFVPEEPSRIEPARVPWYRPLLVTAGIFAAMVLVGTGAIMAMRNDAAAMTETTTTTTVRPAPITPAAASEPPNDSPGG
jgi:Hsp70 protein